jgi:hypothetical protein
MNHLFFRKSIECKVACYFILCVFFFACKQSEKPPYKPAAIDNNPSFAYLSPQESMKTMHLPEGYHLELVASEPVIQEPVAIV